MTIPFHPLANLFPMTEGADFERLIADVRDAGLLEKIVYLDDQILDGRNRYRACLAAGLFTEDQRAEPGMWFREFSRAGGFPPDVIERGPLAWVLSKNLSRRHLNESQRAMVAANLANMRQGERTDVQPSANLPKVSQTEAAERLNVSPRLVRDAKTVKENATPELARAVDQGKLSVSAAAKATKLSTEQQQRVVDETAAGHANAVRTVIKQGVRAEREAALGAKQQALPSRRYGVILADPERRFEPYSRETGMDRAADNHYPTSTDEEIDARNVASIAADDCVLALWCTDLPRGLRTLEAWGFKYVSYRVWVKDIVEQGVIEEADRKRRIFVEVGPPGTGYWFRDRDEICLIGTRGNIPCPAPGTQGESVIFAARPPMDDNSRGRHSAKPDDVYEWAEKHYPNLPKIELNARKARAGWDCWGNEAPANENPTPGDMLGAAGEPHEENFDFPPEVEDPEPDGDNEFVDVAPEPEDAAP